MEDLALVGDLSAGAAKPYIVKVSDLYRFHNGTECLPLKTKNGKLTFKKSEEYVIRRENTVVRHHIFAISDDRASLESQIPNCRKPSRKSISAPVESADIYTFPEDNRKKRKQKTDDDKSLKKARRNDCSKIIKTFKLSQASNAAAEMPEGAGSEKEACSSIELPSPAVGGQEDSFNESETHQSPDVQPGNVPPENAQSEANKKSDHDSAIIHEESLDDLNEMSESFLTGSLSASPRVEPTKDGPSEAEPTQREPTEVNSTVQTGAPTNSSVQAEPSNELPVKETSNGSSVKESSKEKKKKKKDKKKDEKEKQSSGKKPSADCRKCEPTKELLEDTMKKLEEAYKTIKDLQSKVKTLETKLDEMKKEKMVSYNDAISQLRALVPQLTGPPSAGPTSSTGGSVLLSASTTSRLEALFEDEITIAGHTVTLNQLQALQKKRLLITQRINGILDLLFGEKVGKYSVQKKKSHRISDSDIRIILDILQHMSWGDSIVTTFKKVKDRVIRYTSDFRQNKVPKSERFPVEEVGDEGPQKKKDQRILSPAALATRLQPPPQAAPAAALRLKTAHLLIKEMPCTFLTT